jgi:outer membrane protein OmpA-like peptidoglycan-associated protein
MSEPSATFTDATGGGLAGQHLPLPASPAFLAPTLSGKDHNTIKSNLVPFACWRADDVRFEFDSSFVRPEINAEINALNRLIDEHTLPDDNGLPKHRPVLTVFGHADPTGNDDYNKALSGRRGQAVYGLLARDVDLWEDLFAHPQGNDAWDPVAITTMQTALGRPTGPTPASARKALYKDYMDLVCIARDETGRPLLDASGGTLRLTLKPADFLAAGADSGHKGDFQGCGEFNPIMLFSKDEDKEFSKPQNKEARDAENGPNRRVVIFLFRPGVHIHPDDWPCPKAKEGVAACKKRFWSDGEKRRGDHVDDERREYEKTRDTFACRFYDRLASRSPCEAILQGVHISVLLRSNSGAMPLAKLRYKIFADRVLEGTTDKDGLIQHDSVPPGDYALELDGRRVVTLVPTMPRHFSKRTLRIDDFFLIEDGDPDDLPEQDPNKSIVTLDTRDEQGWEVVTGG